MIVYSKSPSKNKKLALVVDKVVQWPFIYASYRKVGETCPTRCGFHPDNETSKVHGRNCYALQGNVRLHQGRAGADDSDGDMMYRWIQSMPPGSGVRLHVSGDVYRNGAFDAEYFTRLCEAFAARPDVSGWMYTHAPMVEWLAMQAEAPANLAVNWSCDSLEEAQEQAAAGVVGLTAVLPKGATRAKGVTICPEQTSGIPCAQCKLCWKGDRKTIVGFLAH